MKSHYEDGVDFLAEEISSLSDQLNDEHYNLVLGSTHYFGGKNHNDDRLVTKILDSSKISVTDGNTTEIIYTDDFSNIESIHSYVEEWFDSLWN